LTKEISTDVIPDVNYHLTNQCNMRCGFCFAKLKNSYQISFKQSLMIVQQLCEFGFTKINFAGGEPLLCNWLPDLIHAAKSGGMTTSVVTNGTLLNEKWVKKVENSLDWIGISIDSLIPETNKKLGRFVFGGQIPNVEFYRDIGKLVKDYGFLFKVNTVVTSLNFKEKLHKIICRLRPIKWKIFQVLPITCENDAVIDDFQISIKEFQEFLHNHIDLKCVTKIIPEDNEKMIGTYIMIDPSGRFFDNVLGYYRFSDPILDVGLDVALGQIEWNIEKYFQRKSS